MNVKLEEKEMKISVEGLAPFAHEMVIKALEAIEDPKISHFDDPKAIRTTVIFEVDAPEEKTDEVIKLMKKTIKGTEKGPMLSFRIVPTGSLVYYTK